MILSEIKNAKTITATIYQRVLIKCDNCENKWDSTLNNQKLGFSKYGKDLCRGCKQHNQFVNGLRNNDKLIERNKSSKNKTLEEILGKDKAVISKQKNSIANSGKNNANFGGKYCHGWGEEKWKDKFKGKTIEEIWGEETGARLRKHYKETRKGENNNMFGKPSPQGSGNGWSGWYKNWHFRSLKELSYMLFVIERFNLKWETAEKSKYKINYIDYKGDKRTYHAAFFINDKYLIEIKPKHLWNSDGVKRKKKAAIEFCKQHNFKYKLTECVKLITYNEIKELINKNELKFIERYEEKFKNLKT